MFDFSKLRKVVLYKLLGNFGQNAFDKDLVIMVVSSNIKLLAANSKFL